MIAWLTADTPSTRLRNQRLALQWKDLLFPPGGMCERLETGRFEELLLPHEINRLRAECSKRSNGEVAEWLMAPVLKTGIPERVSGVRIPPSPPLSFKCRETQGC
jgi:hypothetical protein